MMNMGYVYLIRNGDLYKIGHTANLERRLKQLQPCVLVQSLVTDRSLNLEQELHKLFQNVRIPQTEYFRLNDYQVEQARLALGWIKPQNPPSQNLTGWKRLSQPLTEPKPQSTDPKLWTTPQPAQNPNQGDDWWSLQRKQQGEIRAREREARLQREREERGEDQKLRNRFHWEKMLQAAQEDPGQS